MIIRPNENARRCWHYLSPKQQAAWRYAATVWPHLGPVMSLYTAARAMHSTNFIENLTAITGEDLVFRNPGTARKHQNPYFDPNT